MTADPSTEPPRSLSFDRIAETYDDTRGGEKRGQRFGTFLAPLLDRAEPILEIGIGTGLIAKALQDRQFRIVGVDLSPAMLQRGRARLGPSAGLLAGDATRLPFTDGAFSQAFSVWVLHVVGDVEGVLREVARVLLPGGRYLVIPARDSRPPRDPIGRIIDGLWKRADPLGARRDDEEHLRRLSPAAGLRLVESVRLEAEDYDESPAQALAKIESRSYSVLWDVPDDRLDEVVRPAIEELRALPEPLRPVKRRSSGRIVVLEKTS
jgi:ubiquinone/menaquinone biosynthesis C-methylase UbiE